LVGVGCSEPSTEVISDDNSQTVRVELNGLSFVLPDDWSVRSVDGDTAYFGVPDSEYDVVIPFMVKETESFDGSSDEPFSKETDSGAKIYNEVCAPSLGCRYIDFGGKVYLASFLSPRSNELAPEDLDGPWFPRTEVTQDQLFNVIDTVK